MRCIRRGDTLADYRVGSTASPRRRLRVIRSGLVPTDLVIVDGLVCAPRCQSHAGWGAATGEEEFTQVEMIDGPLLPPQVAKRQTA